MKVGGEGRGGSSVIISRKGEKEERERKSHRSAAARIWV